MWQKIILQEIFQKKESVLLQHLLEISRIDPKYKDDSEFSSNFENLHLILSKISGISHPNP
jgi:hypothetical protein